MAKNTVHVVPRAGDWAVRRSGAERDSSHHAPRKPRSVLGVAPPNANQTELFIHGRNGRIRDRDSFGNDPFPPRDTKR